MYSFVSVPGAFIVSRVSYTWVLDDGSAPGEIGS
jgi:hypothetical protein